MKMGGGVSVSLLKHGGQGRNRTADASLFRDVRSITYKALRLKTKELRDNDLDSIWTPVVNLFEFGLQVDSTICLESGLSSRARAI